MYWKKYKLIIYLNLILILGCSVVNSNYNKDRSFFPKSIEVEMRSDLKKFLKNIPKNKGQQNFIERLLDNSDEYKNIFLFVDNQFSVESIEKSAQLENPFFFIEALDILSYNLHLKNAFSNWYFSKLVFLVKENPSTYMKPFLVFCEKSTGAYAEWFADPLIEIIKSHPNKFLTNLDEIRKWEKICSILRTGNYKNAYYILNKINDYDQIEYNTNAYNLLMCLKNN